MGLNDDEAIRQKSGDAIVEKSGLKSNFSPLFVFYLTRIYCTVTKSVPVRPKVSG